MTDLDIQCHKNAYDTVLVDSFINAKYAHSLNTKARNVNMTSKGHSRATITVAIDTR